MGTTYVGVEDNWRITVDETVCEGRAEDYLALALTNSHRDDTWY
jgi:hypothetical protein